MVYQISASHSWLDHFQVYEVLYLDGKYSSSMNQAWFPSKLKVVRLFFLYCSIFTISACEKKVPVETFKTLHQKIYQSMTISDTSRLYDALDEVFTKSELEKHFKRIRGFHEKKDKENIQIFVDDIEYLDFDSESRSVTVNWIVRGRIKHNQHIHHRSLEYTAKYTLEKQGELWKISQSEIVEHDDFQLSEEELELGKQNDSGS